MATRKQRIPSAGAPSRNAGSGSKAGIAPWLGLAFIVVLLDQLTKITIMQMMHFGESRSITSFFNLVVAYNKGAAFSFLAAQGGWQRWLFTGIALVAVGFILYLLRRNPGQRLFCCALALILGGAIGNLIDRIAYGHVIDFLDFHVAGWHWPAFNVADAGICVGAALFVLDELRRVNR
ncbi:MAG: peptidase [Paucimonas sp.]|nr:peptidase [Paucimonas sp.]